MATSGATDTGSLMATVRKLMSGQVTIRTAKYEDDEGVTHYYPVSYEESQKRIRAVIFAIDSPGGEATQMDELAALIAQLGEKVNTVAFIEGLGASAAYYIAAPCKTIIASRMALVGSIGVVMGVPRAAERTPEGRAVIETPSGAQYVEFVSAQSKLKRADPDSKEGMAYFQHTVNVAADIFIADVARYRNVAEAQVAEKFGYGGVYQASEALDRGMIDEVNGFDAVFERLARAPFVGEDVGQEQDDEGSGESPLEAQNGGDEVARGVLDTILRRGASADAGQQAGGGNGGALPIKEVLTHLAGQREALEQKFTPEALLFASGQQSARKIKPALYETAAYEWLAARCDDALYSGTVVFCRRNEAGQLEEVEGTRVQQVEAKYAALDAHDFGEERITSVREGTALNPVVLNAHPKPPANNSGHTINVSAPGEAEFKMSELYGATEQGRRIAKEKAVQTTGQNSNAVN